MLQTCSLGQSVHTRLNIGGGPSLVKPPPELRLAFSRASSPGGVPFKLLKPASPDLTGAVESFDHELVTTIESQRSRIRAYILRLVRNPAEADDLTQETLLRAHSGLASLRDETALTAWLYRIATRVCYDRFRQISRLPPHDALDEVPEEGDRAPRLDELLERAEMSACVQEFIAKLPDTYRSVILLHDLHGLTSREIADMQACTLETAKIRLHRARARLREALTQGCQLSYDERNTLVCGRKDLPMGPPTSRSRSLRSR